MWVLGLFLRKRLASALADQPSLELAECRPPSLAGSRQTLAGSAAASRRVVSVGRLRDDCGVDLGTQSVVLLGAGASAEAGIPTTFNMTQHLVERVGTRSWDPTTSALHFVCGALIAYDAAEGASPYEGLDVERVFAAVELLAERRTLEVSPFVSAWHPAVDTWDETRAPDPAFFDRHLKEALAGGRGIDPAKRLIVNLIEARTGVAATGRTYTLLAQRMLTELRGLVATTAKDVRYLGPLVQLGNRPRGLTLATLNYDLSIEHAAEAAGIPVTTGLENWVAHGHWKWANQGIRLLKLHGSIDWAWDRAEARDGELPRELVVVTDGQDDEFRRPALVFGRRGKLRAEGPFLGLLTEFEAQLSMAKQLVAVGYSFRDDHVNEVIRRWTAEDASRTILVVDPSWPETFGPATTDFRADLSNHLMPPDWPGAPTFRARLEVQRLKASEAFARLSPD